MIELSLASFSRYLSAKKSVDDRSLNFRVYQRLVAALAAKPADAPLRILELGCGLGTMAERLWDWGLAPAVVYTAVDREPELLALARARLRDFAQRRRLACQESGGALRLAGGGREWLITFRATEAVAFCREQEGQHSWDLLLAHAFLDLVDLDTALPQLLGVVRPGGLFYFTLIFDGETILQPPVDPEFEALLLRLYHRSMDTRQGGRGGHSQNGRRGLTALCRCGCEVLAAGSSDWVIWPAPQGSYPAEEAFFLEYLLATIHQALAGQPELDQDRLHSWLEARQAQISAGELIFLAHQLDLCGRRP